MPNTAIFLRKTAKNNHFRSIVDKCIANKDVDDVLIASGFFQEDHKFSASSIFRPRCGNNLNLTFVGVHNYDWVKRFDMFAKFVASICPLCIKVTTRKPKGMRWHAKVLIASINGVPKIGIIGSSNMTRPAAGRTSPFNFEADVALWEDGDASINSMMEEYLRENSLNGSHEILTTTYTPGGLNGDITLSARLVKLRAEIIETSIEG